MSYNPKTLKVIGLVLWGIILFAIISNQRITLNYIQREKMTHVKTGDYQFVQDKKETKFVNTSYNDRRNGLISVDFSDNHTPTTFLNFRYNEPTQVRFTATFFKTENCIDDTPPAHFDVFIGLNGTEHHISFSQDTAGTVLLPIASTNDQISIRAQAPKRFCGASWVKMKKVTTGSQTHYLLLNAIWVTFIILMLISNRPLLPILSGTLFYIFQKAELLYSPLLTWEQLLLYSSVSIITGLVVSLLVSIRKKKLFATIIVGSLSFAFVLTVTSLSTVLLAFNEIFNAPMTKYDWFAILQTNTTEMVEFIGTFSQINLICKLSILSFLLLLIILFSRKKQSKHLVWQGLTLILIIPVIVLYYTESQVLIKSTDSIAKYQKNVQTLREKVQQRKKLATTIKAQKQATDEIYIIIIGESANRNHFSLYGYPRMTSPKLNKRHRNNNLIRYEQAYSNGISTLGTLGYALTSATLEKGSPYTSPTLMEVLNIAGFDTYWLHNGSTVIRSNLISLIGDQALVTDHLSSIYGTEDGKLLAEIDKALANSNSKSRVIFLKTQGSHVAYCNRPPKGDEWTFTDKNFDLWLIPDIYPTTRISKASNCYDGSIKYTDFLIDETIKRLEATGKVGAVIYLSDHGDDVIRGTAHMGKKYTYGVFSIPMFLWFSENYKNRYHDKYTNAVANAKNIFVNDVLFDSLLGLMNVKYDHIEPTYDISNNNFKDRRLIYRGKKTVYDLDNINLYTPRNIKIIRNIKHPYSIYLGPLEHPFHLNWVTGENLYNQLALTTTYRNNTFILDSPLHFKTPVTLDTVLTYIHPTSEQKFFIRLEVDTPNSNITELVDHVLELIKQKKVNQRKLIVSSSNLTLLEILEDRGVHISYLMKRKESEVNLSQHKAITIDRKFLLESQHSIGDTPVDLLIESCDITSCDKIFFEQLNRLSQNVNIRNVILPMYKI